MRRRSSEARWLPVAAVAPFFAMICLADTMVHFREVQQFRQLWLWGSLLVGPVICVVAMSLPTSKGVPRTIPLIVIGVFALFMTWFWMMKLVTEVHDDSVTAHFVYAWKLKRILFAEIKLVEAVTYEPMRQYGGWGIRLGVDGWAYNVSGNKGVRIHMRDGKNFLIGSQRAEELAEAIEARRR